HRRRARRKAIVRVCHRRRVALNSWRSARWPARRRRSKALSRKRPPTRRGERNASPPWQPSIECSYVFPPRRFGTALKGGTLEASQIVHGGVKKVQSDAVRGTTPDAASGEYGSAKCSARRCLAPSGGAEQRRSRPSRRYSRR